MAQHKQTGEKPRLRSQAHKDMVQLIESRGVTDAAVLRAMRLVPRERFVPLALAHEAYADRPLPIGEGQTISQPYIVGFMSEAAALRPGDRVLEVGTGCGYQAAVLCVMGAKVFSLEIIPTLAKATAARLFSLGYEDVTVSTGDGSMGWAEHAPYRAILVTAAAPDTPPELLDQLEEGGRLIIPVERSFGVQDLEIYTRKGDKFTKTTAFGVRFVPLMGQAAQRHASERP